LEYTRITGCCLLVTDIDRSVSFYTEKVGFLLHRRAFGFAQYEPRNGVHLSNWQIDYFCEQTGLPRQEHRALHKAMPGMLLGSAAEVDAAYDELRARGVVFAKPPKLYPWNAYAAYFDDPDGTIWEIFHWGPGGEQGFLTSGATV
jgi:catechol 2,3-dioxygenase-like lactoylglutathione lyase family enzyme